MLGWDFLIVRDGDNDGWVDNINKNGWECYDFELGGLCVDGFFFFWFFVNIDIYYGDRVNKLIWGR